VTGGNGGLGAATARALPARAPGVIGLSGRNANLDEAVASIGARCVGIRGRCRQLAESRA